MIRHLVLFKLNEGVRRDDPKVVEGVEAFRALEGKIPEIRFWECAWNISDRPIAYDFAINSAFDDAAGVGLWREFATWVIADYEF
ncbi:Dabb family protein [Streptomyces cellulosae]